VQTLSKNVQKVGSDRKGRKTFYDVVDKQEIVNLLISYRESFLDSLVDRFVEMWDVD